MQILFGYCLFSLVSGGVLFILASKKQFLAFFFGFGWPIALIALPLFLPELLESLRIKKIAKQRASLINGCVSGICSKRSDFISDVEYQSFCQAKKDGFSTSSGLIDVRYIERVIDDFLERDIDPHISIVDPKRRRQPPKPKVRASIRSDRRIMFSLAEPQELETREQDWSFKISTHALKAIKKTDKITKARIMSGLAEICTSPLEIKGKTQKPLEGDKKGVWSYRIGDFRLLYIPDETENLILFVSFASRGSVYS